MAFNPRDPFVLKWYNELIDSYISPADRQANSDEIIASGFQLPDADGSRKSLITREASLNNTFDYDVLVESLNEIYMNTSHRLKASNNDTVNFFQWHGRLDEMSYIPGTSFCEFRIPHNLFITTPERELFKKSQFYRKWIKIEDILNNWNVFKWHLLVFINRRIFSEYEIQITEQETRLRFQYDEYWKKKNFDISIYKFDTNYQKRILITRELCVNRWDWKLPLKYIDNQIGQYSHIVASINKIRDPEYRKDGLTRIDVLGDNLEFLPIYDDYIDLSLLSKFNKNYIKSEATEFLWMSLMVPKFMHEYPVLLPTDVVHRPYPMDIKPVVALQSDVPQDVHMNYKDKDRQVYIDVNGKLFDPYNGWMQTIRPVVLSDAYKSPLVEPLEGLIKETRNIRDLTTIAADTVEIFRDYTEERSPSKVKIIEYCDKLLQDIINIKDALYAFFDKRMAERDAVFDYILENQFIPAIEDIKKLGMESLWVDPYARWDLKVWDVVSPLIYIPRELIMKYSVVEIIYGMKRKLLYGDHQENMNKIRFQRPIDTTNFWTFEYDSKDAVWRPYPLKVTHHFPDAYTFMDSNDPEVTPGRVFKTFIFYSDTMASTNLTRDIEKPVPQWDENVFRMYGTARGSYCDIFMEKIYWVGIETLHKKIRMTDNKWELLEYVMNNEYYSRYNDLFLKTVDPYFKLGLATYLRSGNFEFPFDYALEKFREALEENWDASKKVTNFELYLNNQWIPSYFDTLVKILNEYAPGERIIHRPPSSFDIRKLHNILIEINKGIITSTQDVLDDLNRVLVKLQKEDYKLRIPLLDRLKDGIIGIITHLGEMLSYIESLDMQIYSMEDLNHIVAKINNHYALMGDIEIFLNDVAKDVNLNNIYFSKRELMLQLQSIVRELPAKIKTIADIINAYKMHEFMLAVNDLRSYLDGYRYNPDDNSTIGEFNEFNYTWTQEVKDERNKLYLSTAKLYGSYNEKKSYSSAEVEDFVNTVKTIQSDMKSFRKALDRFYLIKGIKPDDSLNDKLDDSESLINEFDINLSKYHAARNDLLSSLVDARELMSLLDKSRFGKNEAKFYDEILSSLDMILESLSYLAGSQKLHEAKSAYTALDTLINKWLVYIDAEEEVFQILLSIVKVPSPFLVAMEDRRHTLMALIEYMNKVTAPFYPDKHAINLSEVFEATEIEIVNSGLRYEVGENLYFPNLGSYEVTSVDDDLHKITAIKSKNFRGTSFRNPLDQHNPHLCVSNLDGLGALVKPTKGTRIPIVDDKATRHTINRISAITKSVHQFLLTPNPFNNAEFRTVIQSIEKTKASWDELVSKYHEHLTADIKTKLTNATERLVESIPASNEFIVEREKINIKGIVNETEQLVDHISNYAENHSLTNENFYYQQHRVGEAVKKIDKFYGDGRTWYDGDRLIDLLAGLKSVLELYRNVFLDWDKIRADEFNSHINEIIAECNLSQKVVLDLRIRRLNIIPFITEAGGIIASINIEKLHKDKWYRFNTYTPANRGAGYKTGDIISIIPQISKNQLGYDKEDNTVEVAEVESVKASPVVLPSTGGNISVTVNFRESEKDMILKDVLIFQVTEVDSNGGVLAVAPLMDYAIPYLVWGIRETNTLVGEGTNFSIDLNTKEIGYKDSTLINGMIPLINQYGDNDLFAFKFDNIHDLNINYEVYVAGKQITKYIQRHEDFKAHNLPRRLDVLYVNANLVMNLRNASIYIPAEDYFVYRINNITITEPGKGYCKGQDIFVDVGDFALRLKVASLMYSPYGEIKEVGLADGKIEYEKVNPGKLGAFAIKDDLSNIDDEYADSTYDLIPREGLVKPLTRSYPTYTFTAMRHDLRENGSRNKYYPHSIATTTNHAIGDPDEKWMLGSEIPNAPVFNRIENMVSPLHPHIKDYLRLPPGFDPQSEYHRFDWTRIHHSDKIALKLPRQTLPSTGGSLDVYVETNLHFKPIEGDLTVATFKDLPQHSSEWPGVQVGHTVIVERDETNGFRRMKYRVRTFYVTGYLVYNLPEDATYSNKCIEVDWMNSVWYSDQPCLKQQYAGEHWRSYKSYRSIEEAIFDKKLERTCPVPVRIKKVNYIDHITLDDLAVYNLTLKKWENLYDENRWRLEVIHDDEKKQWGFKLHFLQGGFFSYDMKLYWIKTPTNQLRNALLKRKAEFNIESVIVEDISTPAMTVPTNIGRKVRIRKLFPYYQKESFVVGVNSIGEAKYDMDFRLAKYNHYRNEFHLADVKLFNKTLGRFEDILDKSKFEVRFKSDLRLAKGVKETQTRIVRTIVSQSGEGFTDGPAWGYNEDYDVHVFGLITARLDDYGPMLTFTPIHCTKLPEENTMIEFTVFQHDLQTSRHNGAVILEFKTEEIEVWSDGYLHNVTNPMAPLPDEIKIIALGNFDSEHEYDVMINKTPEKWEFIEPRWIMTPTFKIKDTNIQQNRLYIITDKGRFPLRNPSTGYPTMRVTETGEGTDVTFLNIYRKMEHLEVHSTPYPMRSVYVQRRIPKHGYLDLKGKLNKPLSKKHYEFWMNGRLLDDEVNIITPTKIIFHGLKSLRNFEIIEVNRDYHEYFSDLFLSVRKDRLGKIMPNWDYTTYLDRVLEGESGFSLEEQAALLHPVWPQVPLDHPEYKNYPPNVDIEDDIILRIHTVNDLPIVDLDASSYQFLLHDLPTLEGVVLAGRLNFDQFGLRPISEHELIDMLNEEWKEEIKENPLLPEHSVISDEEWYGMVAKMYNHKGRVTDDPEEALYKVYPLDVLNINTSTRRCKIIRKKYPEYNFN